MNSGKVILSALAGVAIGAALGILFAPDKGTATRHKISKKKNDITDELERKFNAFVDSFSRKFENLHDEAHEMADEVKYKAKSAAERVTGDKNSA